MTSAEYGMMLARRTLYAKKHDHSTRRCCGSKCIAVLQKEEMHSKQDSSRSKGNKTRWYCPDCWSNRNPMWLVRG